MTIGIDPGVTGAVAVFNKDGYWSEDMPVITMGTKNRYCINPIGLKELLINMGKQTVYLERVHAMPKNGGIGNFSMGDSFGAIRATCMTLGYPLVLVTPQSWKKFYNLSAKKEQCRARAVELFPEENFNRKKDIDRAEAMLIAHYGYHQ